MTYQVFDTRLENRVFWIVLNNPAKRNAMGKEFFDELPRVFAEAVDTREVRAIVLAAEGKTFCAGMDLMALAQELPMIMSGEAGGRAKQEFVDTIRRFQSINSAPERCRKPVIAAIHGHCIGGGLDLVAACDIRLATSDAVFSLREAAVAMISDLGSLQRLTTVIGEGLTREMALTAGNYDADRALAMHLVNRVYDTKEVLYQSAQRMAEEIAVNSPLAVETTKEVLNWGRGRTVAEGLEYAAMKQAQILPNPDLMEAVSAFVARRKPDYKDE